MEDVTILIQGRLNQECYDFFVENYTKYPYVVISTWINSDIDFTNLPANFTLIKHKLPEKPGYQNLNYQLTSTLNGLQFVKTKYVIKQRGDEYWSNIDRIADRIQSNDDKIFTSPIWFRHWEFAQYHASDHLIAGTKENLELMFLSTRKSFVEDKFVEYYPEITITKSYLEAKNPKGFKTIDGRIMMADYFEILDLVPLKPYKVEAKIYFTSFYNDFIPHKNYSIGNVKDLFEKMNK